MCKNRSWAWVAKIGDRQTGACYFVSEVSVLKATLCATSVVQILITCIHVGIVGVAYP